MNFSSFIAGRITFTSKRTFSKLIVRIAVVGIMLGLGVMILSIAIVKGFKQEIREKIRGFAGDMQVVKFDLNNSYENSPFVKDDSFVKQALKDKQIVSIKPFATKPAIIKANDEIEGIVLKGVDKTYDWHVFNKTLLEGKVIDFSDSVKANEQIIVSRHTADRLKLKVGDDILMYFVQEPLRKRKLSISGIYSSGVDEVDKTFVIGSLALIQRLNNWESNEIGGYEVRIANFDKLAYADEFLDTVIPVRLKSYTIQQNYPTIFEWLKLLDVNARVMLVLMLVVAVINMISALLIMILERTSMIGMFKALGANNWRIQKIFLYNAFYLIGLGLILGNIFGLGLSLFQFKTHFFKLDPASYYMSFVPVQLNAMDVILLNIGTLIICLLVMLIPSALVSKIQPVKAIRFK
ncbi:ABC transporter permease [Mucilaginibacter sp. UR6-1]|uniref:ABC transporter permease n=1 Tax=Mucilaginibacter sp. UR6-1 TaxID=1435643 RepID=UPI001E5451B4|nr:FtsX-like permease family protein [Mucilaginibacter sp. UR6-1]MCC8408957.1 ABC transporter permease [Mucilaginibacter sp. UR6-1]